MAKEGDYVVVDIETTGLSRRRHKITEIAAIKVKDGQIIDEFSTLVNPRCSISPFITRLTGIDDELVRDAPYIEHVLPAFLKFLGSSVLVAHNATFDYNFLNHNCSARIGKEIRNPKLCTRKLAGRLLPDLPSKRLGILCEHFNITNESSHRARGDALATAQLLNIFLTLLEENGIKDKENILRFQDSRR